MIIDFEEKIRNKTIDSRRMPSKIHFNLLLYFSLLGLTWTTAWCADKEWVEVYVSGVDSEIADNVRAHLSLVRRAAQDEFSTAWLKRLHRRADGEIRAALQPFGYYHPEIVSELVPPRDPGAPWQAVYHIQAGEPVRLQDVVIRLHGEAKQDPAFQKQVRNFPLKVGDVLRQDVYERAKENLMLLTDERGYFEAKLTRHEIRLDPATRQAFLYLTLDSGPRYRFGAVTFEQDQFSDSLLQEFVPFRPGAPYLGEQLLAFRNNLGESDYFSAIDLQSTPDAKAEPPEVRVTVTPKLRRRDFYQARLGYGTDTGLRAGAGLGLRYLNRWGHSLNAAAGARENRNKQVINLDYTLPRTAKRGDFWRLTLRYTGEDYSTEDAGFTPDELAVNTTRVEDTYLILKKQHRRKLFGADLEEHLFVGYMMESYDIFNLLFASHPQVDELRILFADDLPAMAPDYQVLYPGLIWNYRTGSDDQSHGEHFKLTLQGSRDGWGSNLNFWQASFSTTLLRKFGARHQLTLRAEVGYTDAETTPVPMTILPLALQFRTGGDHSVRGYEFNELNATDSFSYGKHMLTGGIEYQYRVLPQWSGALFLDAGNAFNEDDFSVPLSKGAGFGVRWHSPVGEVRLDFATALDKEGNPWRVHVNIGPSF